MNTQSRAPAAQRGFGITELMIGTGLSLSVIASALTGYLALSTSAMHTLATAKLSQDVAALMQLMANELRRAGHSGTAVQAASNPFAQLAVFADIQANRRQAPTGRGSCVVYAYDADGDGSIAASELAGFRLTSDGAVQMRTSGNRANPASCSGQGATWIALTDPDFITVDALHFDFAQSSCFYAGEPDGIDGDADGTVDDADEADCYASAPDAGSGAVRVEQADIAITVNAHLARDASVRLTQMQRVRPRNVVVGMD